MPNGFSERLRQEVRAWIDQGIVTPAQAGAILARYPVTGGPEPARTGWVTNLLYAAAGILLGAAAISLVMVGLEPQDPSIPLMTAGLVLLAAGAAAWFALPRTSLLPDAGLVAALPPLVVATFDSGGGAPGPVAMVAAAVLLGWRHQRTFVQALCVVAFSVAAGSTYFELFDQTAGTPWLLTQAALLGAVVVLPRLTRQGSSTFATALAVLALGISWTIFLGETLNIEPSEAIEGLVGLLAAALLGLGITLKDRGVVLGALVVGCVDAIAFAFDVGGPVLGTVVLVALAAALIWQAEFLRTHLARDA